MATGLARGAAQRGKRVAFGDRRRIIWGPWSKEIFAGNPNIAEPGSERASNIEWIEYYKGHRLYNSLDGNRWKWNYNFRAMPGQFYFTEDELAFASSIERDFVLIEPNVPWQKSVAPNKDWGLARYQAVADRLMADGHIVAQFEHGRDRIRGARVILAKSFRQAAAALTRARIALLPEGGLHHAAAAVALPAIVLFGGFIPPEVTGYDGQISLTGGAEACGSLKPCPHCRRALDAISVEEVESLCR